jgi:hypothetical protein
MFTYFVDRLIPQPVKSSFPLRKTRHICLYKIIEDSQYPFLLFYVQTNAALVYQLPTLKDKLVLCVADAITLFFAENVWLLEEVIQYRGVIETADDIYIILQHEQQPPQQPEVPNNAHVPNAYAWALASELVNSKRIFHYPIAQETTRFFVRNSDLLLLYANDKPYPCPDPGYYPTTDLSLTLKYGLERTEGSLGYRIYFQRYSAAESGGGTLRCAVFSERDDSGTLSVNTYKDFYVISSL